MSQLVISSQSTLVPSLTKSGKAKSINLGRVAANLYAPLPQIMPSLSLDGFLMIPVEFTSKTLVLAVIERKVKDKDTKVEVTQPIRKFVTIKIDDMGLSSIVENEDGSTSYQLPAKTVAKLFSKVYSLVVKMPLKRMLLENATDETIIRQALQAAVIAVYQTDLETATQLTELYLQTTADNALYAALSPKQLVDYLTLQGHSNSASTELSHSEF